MNVLKLHGRLQQWMATYFRLNFSYKEVADIGGYSDTKISIIMKNKESGSIQILPPGTISITWCIDDFETKASQMEESGDKPIYDRSKFYDALHEMARKHDAEIGITWDTVQFYLDEMCELEEPEDEEE